MATDEIAVNELILAGNRTPTSGPHKGPIVSYRRPPHKELGFSGDHTKPPCYLIVQALSWLGVHLALYFTIFLWFFS